MKQLQLIDRVVVEVLDAKCDDCRNSYVAAKLREIADLIESGVKGGDVSKPEDYSMEVLWEHEWPNYGGFRMGDKSLIGMHYYGSEKKDEFPVITLMREDLEQKGFDTSNLGDEWMERIASKVGDILLDSDYWEHLVWAAEYYKVPRKELGYE